MFFRPKFINLVVVTFYQLVRDAEGSRIPKDVSSSKFLLYNDKSCPLFKILALDITPMPDS